MMTFNKLSNGSRRQSRFSQVNPIRSDRLTALREPQWYGNGNPPSLLLPWRNHLPVDHTNRIVRSGASLPIVRKQLTGGRSYSGNVGGGKML